MVVFTVFIAGGLESVHQFEVEEGSRGVITVTLPYTTAVSIDDTFEIKTDGTTWIKGKVQRIKIRRRGMTNTKVLTCYGKTHTLYEKYCIDFGFHQYFNKDVGWIANDLVDHYFGGILTSVNVNVATGVVLTHFECDGRSVGEALETLALRGDCNFYVDNDDDVHFFVRPGAASGLTAEDLGEIKIVDESGRKFVKVIVRGRHRAIQASAGANYPEFFYQDDRIISTAEAGEVAAAMVAELGAARQQVVAREDSFMETRAGKTIILNVPADGFNNQVIEIQKIRWVCKPPNLNKTYFTLGDKEPTIDSVLAKLARGVTWLPDVQIQRGAAFPTDPFDGQAFTLTQDVAVPGVYYGTADGILYTWDATNSVWKRPPANLGRRAGDPAAGGEVDGDEYYNTTDDKLYQWSGVAWVAIASMDLVDFSGDLDDIPDGVTYARALNAYITGGKPDTKLLSQIDNGLFTADAAGRGKFVNNFIIGNLIAGNVVAASHMIAMTHAIGLPAFSWNGGATRIEWGEFPIAYKGTTYTVAAGNSQLKYITWDFSVATNALQSSDDEPGQGANPALTDDDVFMCINYQDGSWDEPATQTIISGPSITTDWITARKFRTSLLAGLGTGPGVVFDTSGVYGYGAGGVLQAAMQSADGKIVAGAGIVTLAANGITIKGQGLYFTDAADALRGWVWGLGGANPFLQVAANAGDLKLTSGAGKYVELLVAGNSVRLNPAGDIVFADNFDAIVPTTTGNLDLGTALKQIGKLWADDGDFETQLTIPRYNGADPVAPVSGDIWLREDL